MTAGKEAKRRAEPKRRGRVSTIRRLADWLRKVAAAMDDPDSLVALFRSLR